MKKTASGREKQAWAERQARQEAQRRVAEQQLRWLLSPDGAGLSQSGLARELEVPDMTVWRWVHGQVSISGTSARILALVYAAQGGPSPEGAAAE